MMRLAKSWFLAAPACLVFNLALGGPYVGAGDLGLRHDIQVLADHGVIRGPVSTWPLAWGPLLVDIAAADSVGLPESAQAALLRVRERADWDTRTQEVITDARFGIADNRSRIRSFHDTPRGRVEIGIGVAWIDDWASVEVNAQGVDTSQDDDEVRFDDSLLAVAIGNWSIGVSTQQRWWGPGWDGSLILSNNARPVPSLVVDRVFTDPFELRWLRWLGPWDLNVIAGELESDRVVANARFFGMRMNFRPLRNLEFGIFRTAQWCGSGRPCDLDTFADLFVGRDNSGDAGIGASNEPGNQLAGLDFRWSPELSGQRLGFYGQLVGEDEAGGFPSRWFGQFGTEWSGHFADRWSARIYAELAATSCQFYESSELFNCAYNHGIYRTGYRYRGRPIGHGADNDSRMVSVGAILVDDADTRWAALLRYGALNRGGLPDTANSLTPTRKDLKSIDLAHSRVYPIGVIELGLGYESLDNGSPGTSCSQHRVYLQWRSAY